MLKNWLQKVSTLGISGDEKYEDAKKIEFANKISCFFSVIAFFYMGVFMALKSYWLMSLLFANTMTYFICLKLNHLRRFKATNCLIIANCTVAVYLASAMIDRAANGHFFLVILIPLAAMLFNQDQQRLKWGCLVLPIAAFLCLEVTEYHFLYHVIFPEKILRLLAMSVFLITCIILYIMVNFYKDIFQHVRQTLDQAVSIYPLTEREVEIITIVIQGKKNKQIGKELFIQEATVKNHLNSIYKKLAVKSRSELMAKCLAMNTRSMK